jgi:hypothetical protein
MNTTTTVRPINEVAREILKLWPTGQGKGKMYFGAVPYANAMLSVEKKEDLYGQDTAESLVIYFLANATTWKGDDVRRIKAELKSIVGLK